MRPVSTIRRNRVAVALAVAAVVGVAVEISSDSVSNWLWNHTFTTGILVGVLLISATYLVVERALEERERLRWSAAAEPLLRAIAVAGAGTDAEVRACGGPTQQTEWLSQLLERYQSALTGTPELIEHWHAALSLAQHAHSAIGQRPVMPGRPYEQAWRRFCETFADVHDFEAAAPLAGETWAALPAVPAGGRR